MQSIEAVSERFYKMVDLEEKNCKAGSKNMFKIKRNYI